MPPQTLPRPSLVTPMEPTHREGWWAQLGVQRKEISMDILIKTSDDPADPTWPEEPK